MDNTPRFLVAAVLCAFAIYWYARRSREADAPPPDPGVAVIDAGVAPGAPPPGGSPPAPAPGPAPAAVDAAPRFRRIDPAARAALLARLAARKAGQPAPPAAAPAPLPGHVDATAVVDSIMPLLPAFQDCYDETRAARTAPQVEVRYALTLVGDAEVGTVISDIELSGDAAFTADPTLATCLRETMLAIELPPMVNGATASFRTSMVIADDPDAPDAGPR
ncbi:MAG: hypothetical protein JNK64_07540 [Myxococcales bacterium]|nr:hypothetical protein [Myxococcales bacterium]